MRASRQTELQRKFPLHVVCSWLGNSPRIAQQSSLLVTEDDFAKAAGVAWGGFPAMGGLTRFGGQLNANLLTSPPRPPGPYGSSIRSHGSVQKTSHGERSTGQANRLHV